MMEPVLVAIAAALVLDTALWHRRFVRALARAPVPAVPPARYPSISVIRPVRGLDVDAADNFRAALATSYAGDVETMFVFDDDEDPALRVAQQVVDEHRASGARGTAEVILASGCPAARPSHRTGKLHAMILGLERARGELIAFGDSDSRPDPALLTALVDALLASRDVGATFAPVVVADPPRTSGDVGYALIINALYGPEVARAAGASGRLPFIMGQVMVFRREAIAAIGGLEAADGKLVDDMYLGECVHRAGYANVMINRRLVIVNRGTPLRRFLEYFRRWMMFGQDGLPFSATWPLWWRGLSAWLAVALLATSLALGSGVAALAAALALVAQGEGLNRLHERFGGAPIPARFRGFAVSLFLFGPFVLATTLRRTVEWRGRSYQVAASRR